MTDQQLKLASEFPEPSFDSWRELAEAGLKGAPFDKVLVTTLPDGIKIKPLYTADDLDDERRAIHEAMVAASNRKAVGEDEKSGWDIRQLHTHPDPKLTNDALREDLENGANSVLIQFDRASRNGGAPTHDGAGESGVMLYSLNDLQLALNGIYFDLAPIGIDAGAAAIPAAALLAVAAQENAAAKLELNIDPLGTLASSGALPTSIESALAELGRIAAEIATLYPQAKIANVNSAHWYNAGATDGTELAVAVASGVSYLRAMVNAGLAVEEAARRMSFTVAVGTDFFAGIAKLRALRLMWRRVLQASGAADGVITINAVSAEHVLSKVDPWVNMLRTTVTSFAGGVGGADSVTCLPYDHLIGLPDDFSRRIARNTQLILEEESNVHQVLDPAGGSFYIENLTKDFADVAWARFQQIEQQGGIANKLRDGSLVAEVESMWQTRQKRLATRRDPLTGVSEFPHIDEDAVKCQQPDLPALKQAAKQRLTSSQSAIGKHFADLVAAAKAGANIQQLFDALYADAKGESVTALTKHCLAEDFEALRERGQRHTAAGGARPSIFMANIGRVAEHTARATFARNFFEAGGIKAVTNDGFADADTMAAAFAASGASIAVICGSDAQYDEFAEAFAKALKAKGAQRVYLAGRAGDKADAYAAAGIDDYVGMGGNVLAICSAAMDQLGVK